MRISDWSSDVCSSDLILLSGTALAQTASSQAVQDSDAPASSDAQTRSGAGTGANDIIVTATRRNERLQDVPLSITAFSQADLTAKGIVGYEGLAQNTPGVVKIGRASCRERVCQ